MRERDGYRGGHQLFPRDLCRPGRKPGSTQDPLGCAWGWWTRDPNRGPTLVSRGGAVPAASYYSICEAVPPPLPVLRDLVRPGRDEDGGAALPQPLPQKIRRPYPAADILLNGHSSVDRDISAQWPDLQRAGPCRSPPQHDPQRLERDRWDVSDEDQREQVDDQERHHAAIEHRQWNPEQSMRC